MVKTVDDTKISQFNFLFDLFGQVLVYVVLKKSI